MSGTGKTRPRRPVILCVEDEPDLRSDLAEELTEAGYSVLEASNGREALAQIEAARPDLVLCDISMPVMGGYEVLRALQDRPSLHAETPFLFLSALADPGEIIEGKRLGADDYLVKPVDFDLMLATIEARLRQIDRIRERRSAETNASQMAPADPLGRILDAASGVSGLLDVIAIGIVLLDKEGLVVFANRAARQIAARSDDLRIDRSIRACHAPQRTQFEAWLREALHQAMYGDESLSSHRLPRSNGKRDLMLLASALPGQNAAVPAPPALAIFVTDPENRPAISETALAALFGLTPTETQVTLALTQGIRTADIAARLGIAPTTLAFHMRNIFQKTGTSRQAELVALLLAGPAAIVALQEREV